MRVCPAQDRHSLRHNHALGSPLPARFGLSANLLRDVIRSRPRRAPSATLLSYPVPFPKASACAEAFFMPPAEGLFFLMLLFPRPACFPPRSKDRRQSEELLLPPVPCGIALPETKKSPAAQKRQGTKSRTAYGPLDHAGDDVHAFTAQHGDGRHFDERMAAGLQAGRGASAGDQHLSGQGRVVDAHVELEDLVVGHAGGRCAP